MNRIALWAYADLSIIMQPEQNILLFDGICNLCNSLVKFIIRHDRREIVKFAPLQSEAAKGILQKFSGGEKLPDSVVFLSGNRIHMKSAAVLQLMKVMGWPWKLFYLFIIIPRFVRDFMYDIIAGSRYRIFGVRKECMIPGPDVKRRFLV